LPEAAELAHSVLRSKTYLYHLTSSNKHLLAVALPSLTLRSRELPQKEQQ